MEESTTEAARQVDAILEVLAERFGTTVDALWSTLVSYHLMVGWGMAAMFALTFVIFAPSSFFWVRHALRKGDAADAMRSPVADGFGWRIGAFAPTVAFWFVWVAAILTEGVNIFTRITTPEYHAIKDILSRVG